MAGNLIHAGVLGHMVVSWKCECDFISGLPGAREVGERSRFAADVLVAIDGELHAARGP